MSLKGRPMCLGTGHAGVERKVERRCRKFGGKRERESVCVCVCMMQEERE